MPVETARSRREDLQQADHPEIGHERGSHKRADAQGATDLRIDTRIIFHIVAPDQESAANAFSRETLFYVHGGSQRRSRLTGSRPADHLVLGEKRQGRAAGTRETESARGNKLQNCIDIVADLADLDANCFHRREPSAFIGDRDDSAGFIDWQ